MKYGNPKPEWAGPLVTLCVRVWIEITPLRMRSVSDNVTLCVRVWIEMMHTSRPDLNAGSHPLREGVD